MIFTDDLNESTVCNIVSTNVATVTATGGAIAYGTQNVIIYCLCIRDNIAVVGGTTHWFLNGTQITETTAANGGPYLRKVVPSQLIIPSFVNPYNGTYSCGSSNDFSTASSHINLTLAGVYV